MEINALKTVKVNAKTLSVCVKVCDRFCANLLDQDGAVLHTFEDTYVPDFMPGQHYGDYLMLDIDLDSGQIINWKKPSPADIENIINKQDEE